MKIIYVDSLFLLNFIIDYLLLVVTARVCSITIARRRYLIAAIVGGAYSVMCFMPNFEVLSSATMKLVLWLLISLIAFGCEARLFRCALSFLCISASFGGGVWALSMFWGDGFLYLDLRIMLLSFAICYAALSLVFSGKFSGVKSEVLHIRISHRDKTAEFYALRDTGNLLRDNISGKAVLVCSLSAVCELFSPAEISALSHDDSTEALLKLADIPDAPKFYPILYSTVGASSGLLPCFSPEYLYVDRRLSHDYVLAITTQNIGSEEYSAVI